MRAKLVSQRSHLPPALVAAIVRFAGSEFPQVKGAVRVFITECRRPGCFSGNGGVRRVIVRLPPTGTIYPLRLVHGYRRFSVDASTVREAGDTSEVLVWLLGHELGHETKWNHRLRRGAQERHSDRCGAELLDTFRLCRPTIEAEATASEAASVARAAAARASAPQNRLETLEDLRRRWVSRLTRAQNKVRSLDRKIKAQRRKMEALPHL